MKISITSIRVKKHILKMTEAAMSSRVKAISGFLAIPLIVVALMIFIVLNEPPKSGITRAMAARSVALAVCSPEEFQAWTDDGWASHFSFSSEEVWYVSWLDYMYSKGYLNTDETPADRKTAEGMLTYGEAWQIASAIDPSLEHRIHKTEGNQDDPLPEDLWWKFYDALLKTVDPEGAVHEETLILYGTAENLPEAEPWAVYTDQGTRIFTGLALDAYIDHQITALVREDEMICVRDVERHAVLDNVWIMDGDSEQLRVYAGGVESVIPFRKSVKQAENLVRNMADLELSDGKIVKVSVKKDRVKGKMLSMTDSEIEIEGYGSVQLTDDCQYLKICGDLEPLDPAGILVGSDNLEYVTAHGKVCAVLMSREASEDKIRVLIMNQGFKGIFHDRIALQCKTEMTMTQGEKESSVSAGEALEFLPGDERLKHGRVILTPQEDAEITLTSLERTDGQPSYGGRLEILDTEDGIVLINEIYLEDYLKKVVPSEMPGSFELEALKVQAVCARTYAYTQMKNNRYSSYGAQIDDSTNYQVYNNVDPEPRAEQAVRDTYGKLLMYNGRPISAYYFSTSCGNTTDGSVWDMDPEDVPYLKSVALQSSRKSYDWSKESEFAAYIKRNNVKSYDSDSLYFRWKMTTTADRLAQTFDGIGTITSVTVTKRGGGGVALELQIRGTDGEMTISGQNSIRAALGDETLSLIRNDGSTSTGWSSLPSAFLVVEPDGRDENGIQKFTIYGGGYGHGAGMSQNGAQGMAKEGMKYDEILKFFYEGVSIEDWE
jgi:stage II sporulation protein D